MIFTHSLHFIFSYLAFFFRNIAFSFLCMLLTFRGPLLVYLDIYYVMFCICPYNLRVVLSRPCGLHNTLFFWFLTLPCVVGNRLGRMLVSAECMFYKRL